jgi:septal ring factor EnvC (AmiA/AmiB activator)
MLLPRHLTTLNEEINELSDERHALNQKLIDKGEDDQQLIQDIKECDEKIGILTSQYTESYDAFVNS